MRAEAEGAGEAEAEMPKKRARKVCAEENDLSVYERLGLVEAEVASLRAQIGLLLNNNNNK